MAARLILEAAVELRHVFEFQHRLLAQAAQAIKHDARRERQQASKDPLQGRPDPKNGCFHPGKIGVSNPTQQVPDGPVRTILSFRIPVKDLLTSPENALYNHGEP